MKDKKILKGNKLIAIFMIDKDDKELKVPGMIYQQDAHDGIYIKDYLDKEDVESFKYHKSWNWLMPVVEKICSLDLGKKRQVIFDLYPSDKNAFLQVREQKENIGYPIVRYYPNEHEEKSYIEHSYLACIEFIKWYNKNK